MSTILQTDQLRSITLGSYVSKAYPTIAVETKTLFTIAGGLVAVTSLVGRVTTAITVAGTTKLQHNPTAGTTVDLCAATDIGTTDTAVGEIIVIDGLKTSTIVLGALAMQKWPIVLETGTIEQVTATGADGGITWALTYVPIDTGASIVAA